MTIKSFSTSCNYPTNHMATVPECKRCKHLKSASYGVGVINCSYDEDHEPIEPIKPVIRRNDANNFAEDKNFISDHIANH